MNSNKYFSISKNYNPNPLVSIALCVYNGEKFLEKQLQTLLNQTYKNLELIIVDDGSTDRSLDIIEHYAKDKRLKLFINEKNLGYVKNFEKAIGYCSGNYIALADQDDIWHLKKIEILVNQVEDAVLIYHDSELIDIDGTVLGKMSDILNMYSGNSPLPFLFYNCVSGHSCLFRKDLVLKLGFFNPLFYHDWWLAYVAASSGKIKYINQTLVKYRQHSLSSTDILNRKKKLIHQSPKYAEINLLWLKNCQRINSKCEPLIEDFIYLNETKCLNNSVKLLYLLFKHYHELFFLKKKNRLSKLNYIRKIAFYNREHYHTI